MQEFDLFGNEIEKNLLLRDRFIEPPFSVLDTRQSNWLDRKRKWLNLGIKSEIGRDSIGNNQWNDLKLHPRKAESTKKIGIVGESSSIFDPALTELMYNWFCVENGNVLDPFAGGSVRGVVAHYLNYNYTGIELRKEQIESNLEQANKILNNNIPNWICGDSDIILDNLQDKKYDFIFSCPPYHDLEIYSNLPNDLSNMSYDNFKVKYESIIKKSLKLLKKDCYACFVVGEIRDKKGYYKDFVSFTKQCFIKNNALLYNDAILLNTVGSASMRAAKIFESGKKLTKIHQNVLIFKKGI
jgi:DNA modification methylase